MPNGRTGALPRPHLGWFGLGCHRGGKTGPAYGGPVAAGDRRRADIGHPRDRPHDRCPPGHGLGRDGKPGLCPQTYGILQNRYPFERASRPGIGRSTAMNADTAYAIWRSWREPPRSIKQLAKTSGTQVRERLPFGISFGRNFPSGRT